MADSDIDRAKNQEPSKELEVVSGPFLGLDENGFDLSLPYDETPGPYVISPFNQGTRPRPGQTIAKGL